jgi:preprotein translocase subunit SecA
MVSLEDELMTVYIAKLLRWVAALTLKRPDHFMARWLGKVLFGKAQRRAERLHARMRHDLLRIDEQLSESLAFTGRSE